MRAFLPFVKTVSSARRAADSDESKRLIAQLFKLLGNASWGSLIMDFMKFCQIKFVKGHAALTREVNTSQFQNCTHLKEDFYEVESKYKTINLGLPIQLGFFVLQYAKLRMLQFFYDFLVKNCERSKFVLCQSDTDSIYVSIAGKELADIVKPNRKAEFDEMLNGFCSDDENDNVENRFLSRTCCAKHNAYDQRLPGVNKVEYEGHECISLCSKTYIAVNDEGYKLSAKGVNKSLITSPYKKIASALEEKKEIMVQNTGIRSQNARMYTYTQNKIGFTSWYCKRVVQPDFVSTKPLTITLKPPKLQECTSCSELTSDVSYNGDAVLCMHCANFLDFCGE